MTVTLILLASQQIVVEANWVGAGEKDKGESPPHWRQPVPAKGVGPVGAACRALAGPSHPSATLQNPARLHRGTCRADCFSRPPRAVGVVHERGGDRATGQGGSSQVTGSRGHGAGACEQAVLLQLCPVPRRRQSEQSVLNSSWLMEVSQATPSRYGCWFYTSRGPQEYRGDRVRLAPAPEHPR